MNSVVAVGQPNAAAAGSELGASVISAAAALPAASIAEQCEEVGRELRNRERYYPGRLKPETAALKLSRLAAAFKTMQFIATNAEGLRLLVRTLQRVAKYGPADDENLVTESEAQTLLQIPAVRAVVDAFPGCTIAAIRSIKTGDEEIPFDMPEFEESEA